MPAPSHGPAGYAENDGKTAGEVGAAFRANYSEVFPNLNIYASHKEMLEKEPQLDILTVGVSDHRHADIIVDAANAGVKGIFCEKPLATTLEDTDRMLEACERNGVILSVDHTRRFLPIWRYCKEQLVDKGAIGEIQYIVARLHGNAPHRTSPPPPPPPPARCTVMRPTAHRHRGGGGRRRRRRRRLPPAPPPRTATTALSSRGDE
eukprot:SAG22_NODE_178_length_16142_cov_13.187995_5_plen_206_part_00